VSVQKKRKPNQPTIAPSMEMDELEKSATEEEIKDGDYTPVTKLVIDRILGDHDS
jgi:hypothetical protein